MNLGSFSLLTGEGGLLDNTGGNTPVPSTNTGTEGDWFSSILRTSGTLASDYMQMRTAEATAEQRQSGVLNTAQMPNNYQYPTPTQIGATQNSAGILDKFSALPDTQKLMIIGGICLAGYFILKKN